MADSKDSKTRLVRKRSTNDSDATVYVPGSVKVPDRDATRYRPASARNTGPRDATLVAPEGGANASEGNRSRSRKTASGKKASHHGLLKNRFLLQDVLGAGGMGVVYKAKDRLKIEARDRDPYVAIKVLSDEFKSHPEAFIALQRESRKTQRIAHPNIVNVYDFDRDGGNVFMTMEFLDGKPLDKMLAQYRNIGLPWEDSMTVLEGICSALQYAHAENIIHSDLKPGNIFVTYRGTPKVFDFGIARAVAKAERSDDGTDKTVFDAGSLGALTPAYASLEMLEGEPPDPRDDLYALGCIAYEMLAGDHPFDRVHADEAVRQKLKPKRIAGLNKYQWRAIESALAFRREERMASVEAFWRLFTHRRVAVMKYAVAATVVLTSMAAAAYQYRDDILPRFSEQDVRSEIEQQLRLELKREALQQLREQATFTASWEEELLSVYADLKDMLGADDIWLEGQRSGLYQSYLVEIVRRVDEEAFERALSLTTNARRFTDDNERLEALSARIRTAREEAKARAEREAQARREAQVQAREAQEAREREQAVDRAFTAALGNVDSQLNCRQQLNMDDLAIAVRKLRELDGDRYREEKPRMVEALSQCIERIGDNFPDRALGFKQKAMQLFPRSAAIAGIAIEPKDPCDPSLAGAGGQGPRSTCRDTVPGQGAGPTLVVIPGFDGRAPYAMTQEEISTARFRRFCRSNGCEVPEEVPGDRPVTDQPFDKAEAYAKWLSEQTDYRYRLPTQEEWQHAAHAQGASPDPNRNCRFASRGIERGGSLSRVGTGRENRWGLVNHLGNAREWAHAGGGLVVLGGSFDTPLEDCRPDHQRSHNGSPDRYTGFRLVRELKTES